MRKGVMMVMMHDGIVVRDRLFSTYKVLSDSHRCNSVGYVCARTRHVSHLTRKHLQV